MRPIVIAGVVLAVIVGVWMFVHGAAGWYRSPSLGWLFPALATVTQLGVLIWGLGKTKAQGRRYGGQVVAGLLISLVGGLLIVVVSFIWSAAFPDVAEVMEAIQADQFADQGMSAEEIDEMLETTAFTRTPAFGAILGFIMTMLTGLVLSLIIAAFVRVKD
ncbi:MAG TPA: DUF4199 domain-containing protein [Candidatus Polarisedimenticolaceae bacterium]|nr:DUF4199 domain-containing protein [Candidatus Polarisedimenticolaceae bacterium]